MKYIPYLFNGICVWLIWITPGAPQWLRVAYTILTVLVLVYYWYKTEAPAP